jgi:hypothetical protein
MFIASQVGAFSLICFSIDKIMRDNSKKKTLSRYKRSSFFSQGVSEDRKSIQNLETWSQFQENFFE